MLALGGGAGGVLLAHWLIKLLVRLRPLTSRALKTSG